MKLTLTKFLALLIIAFVAGFAPLATFAKTPKRTAALKKYSENKAISNSDPVEEIKEETQVASDSENNDGVANADEAEKPSPNIEESVLNSMLTNDFPEKTKFISNEDKKDGTQLGVKPEVKLQASVAKVESDEDMTSMFIKMILTTLALGGVVFLLALLWKWLQGRSGKMFKSQNGLLILSQQVIGPKSKIMVVEAMGRKFLVGATESNIQLLSDMDFYGETSGSDESPNDPEKFMFKSNDGHHVDKKSEIASNHNRDFERNGDSSSVTSEGKLQAASRIKNKLKGLKKLG